MIFAVIPWGEKYNNNELFNPNSSTNKNGLAEPFAELKGYLEYQGHEINTIDIYDDLDHVDYFLFFDWIEEWMDKLIRKGMANRMVYCNAEPPTVRALNSTEGYNKVLKYFPYIMTWNKSLIDKKSFFYRTIPYFFEEHDDNVSFAEKKLLTSISANKKSDYPDELYSERERLIAFFEETIPDQFDMYGVGWDESDHSSYKGRPESKFDTYKNYRFALALENTKNVRGYVTEKILDCLTGNIVPIYMGADDITDYVSKDSFIDYRDFDSPKDLLEYLISVDEIRHQSFIESARRDVAILKKNGTFSGSEYARNIIELAEKADKTDFGVADSDMKTLHSRVVRNAYKMKIKMFVIKMIGKKK